MFAQLLSYESYLVIKNTIFAAMFLDHSMKLSTLYVVYDS